LQSLRLFFYERVKRHVEFRAMMVSAGQFSPDGSSIIKVFERIAGVTIGGHD